MVVDEMQLASPPRPPGVGLLAAADEPAARRSLREQIERLEGALSTYVVDAFGAGEALDAGMGPPAGGPRLLSLGELETVRDELAARLGAARERMARRGESQERNRTLLEKMRLDPRRHKFVRIPREDLGIPGCGAYEVRPRFGVVGMLMGWWQVKLSSGCPLPSVDSGPPDGRGAWTAAPRGAS